MIFTRLLFGTLLLLLSSVPSIGANWPPKDLHPELRQILDDLPKLCFPHVSKARYGDLRWKEGARNTDPIGFLLEVEDKRDFLDFPVLTSVLEQGRTELRFPSVSWQYADSNLCSPVTPQGPSQPWLELRSLPWDAATLRGKVLELLTLPVPDNTERQILLSSVLFAQACADAGYEVEAESLIQPISQSLADGQSKGFLAVFREESGNRLFWEAVLNHCRSKIPRGEAAKGFERVGAEYPGTSRCGLSSEYASILRRMERDEQMDPIRSQPEPPPGEERVRWRIAQLQDQTLEGYSSPGRGLHFVLPNSPFARVLDLGYQAIPALLALDGDKRPTRVCYPFFIGEDEKPILNMEEIGMRLLFQLSGERFDSYDDARKWWKTTEERGFKTAIYEKLQQADFSSLRIVRFLYDVDPQLAMRALLESIPKAQPELAEHMWLWLASFAKTVPDSETIALAQRAIGSQRGSITWCAGILVLAHTNERTVAVDAASSEWMRPSLRWNEHELSCLVRTLVMTGSAGAIQTKWETLSVNERLNVLQSLRLFTPVPIWRHDLPRVDLDEILQRSVLNLVRHLADDKTPIPGKLGVTYPTLGKYAGAFADEFEKALKESRGEGK